MIIPYSPLYIDCIFLDLFKSLIFKNKISNNQIITYSVRTSIDMFFTIKKYPKNSKVLITSINIPTIIDIINYHNLKAVPIDLDINTLDMNKNDLMNKLKEENIVCCLYSHLFGRINDINWVLDICNKNNIDFIEDCAECYSNKYSGNPRSDIICFSFGSIKKCTCFGGSLTILKNKNDLIIFKKNLSKYIYQSNIKYILKIIKYFFISLIINNRFINIFVRYIFNYINIDINKLFINLIRNINSKNILNNIRYQPCSLLINYILYRTNHYKDNSTINENYIVNNLSNDFIIPGKSATILNFWLFPIVCKDLYSTIKINNTSIHYINKISQLKCLDDNCKVSKYIIDNILFLPINSLNKLSHLKYIINHFKKIKTSQLHFQSIDSDTSIF